MPQAQAGTGASNMISQRWKFLTLVTEKPEFSENLDDAPSGVGCCQENMKLSDLIELKTYNLIKAYLLITNK